MLKQLAEAGVISERDVMRSPGASSAICRVYPLEDKLLTIYDIEKTDSLFNLVLPSSLPTAKTLEYEKQLMAEAARIASKNEWPLARALPEFSFGKYALTLQVMQVERCGFAADVLYSLATRPRGRPLHMELSYRQQGIDDSEAYSVSRTLFGLNDDLDEPDRPRTFLENFRDYFTKELDSRTFIVPNNIWLDVDHSKRLVHLSLTNVVSQGDIRHLLPGKDGRIRVFGISPLRG